MQKKFKTVFQEVPSILYQTSEHQLEETFDKFTLAPVCSIPRAVRSRLRTCQTLSESWHHVCSQIEVASPLILHRESAIGLKAFGHRARS